MVETYLQRFDLKEFEHTLAKNLSGGNKRKLTCAIAVLGNPELIVIDEVSAGLDPVSRGLVWKGIKAEAAKSALLVATKSTEEAEYLATRFAIMASGRFQCLGTLSDIQTAYTGGFVVEIQLQIDELSIDLKQYPDGSLITAQFVQDALA